MAQESTGLLTGGVPYLVTGDGPPLVILEGLTPTHRVPTGIERRVALSSAATFNPDFRVYVVNRKQGLPPGASMSDIAGHVAGGLEDEVGEPVLLTGTSTGGSVALQLAVDRPDLVRALVVVASAYRLAPRGRRLQQRLAQRTRAGDGAGALAEFMTELMPTAVRRPLYPLARLVVSPMAPQEPSDMLVTLDAEDAFNVGDQLPRISAPTLVIGGALDPLYTRELFEETAAGVQDGRAHIYPDWGHLRTSGSSTTRTITLGFFLASIGTG